jgi:DNA repair exonuclease SbcCD ATPase subunit
MAIKVRVRNFQSIEDASIEIDGLTVVTGTNNAGKSAFFRAIRGAFTNARGYDFVRHGESHCTVDLEFDDGQTLTWKKGKGVNTYVVNGKELPKVGHGVPPEAAVFGVEPMKAGNSELWPQIAPQITGVSFLLHESGSVVAEAVADVERVNQLSRALKDCESDRRSARSSLKVLRKKSETLNERLEGFSGLDEVLKQVEEIERRRNKVDQVAKATTNLVKLGARLTEARGVVASLDGLEDVERLLPPAENAREARRALQAATTAQTLGERLKGARDKVSALEGLDDVEAKLPSASRVQYVEQFRKAIGVTVSIAMRYERARKELESAQNAEKVLGSVALDDAIPSKARKVKKALDASTRLRSRLEESRTAVRDLDQKIALMEAELEKLTTSLSSVLEVFEECPTCGSGLDHIH